MRLILLALVFAFVANFAASAADPICGDGPDCTQTDPANCPSCVPGGK